ncbi:MULTISPECIES: IclR family transcriptional regulator [unclassified Rhodococcus (in: high G+C Gram-positive bacteria)]|uniref:IclR family transcriptional regulator n=1 Tax=unclassified Rhodococcus (in: high G+C Gram-positive bacteria) TaxID=192944 RepID=UPI001303D7E4|nr:MULTISPECIES: IclR family transcriptional regulator [unclassified Rhodococcus (in: high G+C Gram-positive bacteria)]
MTFRSELCDEEPSGRLSPVLSRMTAVIAAFDDPAEQLQIGVIAERAGLPRSTAHRFVDQLIQLGWLRRIPDGYILGPRMAGIGAHGDHTDLRAAAAPLLHALHHESSVVVHLGVLHGDHVALLDKLGGSAAATIPTCVGDQLPAHATALGKSILATLTPEDVDMILPTRLGSRTARTITSLNAMHAELARIRSRHGVSFDREESAVAVNCIGVPLQCADGTPAAISLSARAPLDALTRMSPYLRDTAHRIGLRFRRRAQPEHTHEPAVGISEVDLTMIRLLHTVDPDDWL